MKEAVALKTLADQDWKTQLAQGYSNIPSGAIVEVINDNYVNFYGVWCEVKWNSVNYYVSKRDLSFDEDDIKIAKQKQNELEQYKDKFRK